MPTFGRHGTRSLIEGDKISPADFWRTNLGMGQADMLGEEKA